MSPVHGCMVGELRRNMEEFGIDKLNTYEFCFSITESIVHVYVLKHAASHMIQL